MAYNLCKYYHNSLIIGYSDNNQTFTLFARLADQNMHIVDVSYSNMLKSYIEKGSWFLLYKYTPNEVTLDIPLIRQELSHYFYSPQSSNYIRGTRYGISAAEYLCEYLTRQHKHGEHMDYRLTRGIMEPKALMVNMCIYLNANGYCLSEDIFELCKKASDSSQRIHLLALKSYANVKINNTLGDRIRKQFDNLIDCER